MKGETSVHNPTMRPSTEMLLVKRNGQHMTIEEKGKELMLMKKEIA